MGIKTISYAKFFAFSGLLLILLSALFGIKNIMYFGFLFFTVGLSLLCSLILKKSN